MTRTLICGPAGSGKTRRVMDEVRPMLGPGPAGAQRGGAGSDARSGTGAGSELRRFLVLVPTYSQAEHLKRRLVRQAGVEGLLDRGVVTFEQLAERRTGIRLATLAPAAVRDGMLAAAFDEHARASGDGSSGDGRSGDGSGDVFAGVARFPGFRRAALRFLDEVKAIEPDPDVDVVAAAAERLAAVAGALPGRRGETIEALVRVLATYERRRKAEGLLDHGDLLRELLRLLRDGRGAQQRWDLFAMDGFTDLTPVQQAIVHRIAAVSDRSLVTLLGDAEDRAGSPFAATDGLRARLVADGFQVEHLPASRRATGDLLRLERRVAGVETPPAPADGSVRFLAGADPEDEADRVARTVLRWTTEGIPRAEILVVVRSLASDTAGRVVDALRRHGVPARAGGGEPLPSVQCVRSVLRAMRVACGAADADEVVAAVRQGDAAGVADIDGDRLGLAVRQHGAADEAAVFAQAVACGAATAAAWIETARSVRLPASARPPARVAEALFGATTRLVRLRFTAPFDPADEASVARDAAAMRALRDLAADLVRALRAAGVASIEPRGFADRLAAAAETSKFRPRDVRDDAVNVVDAEEARQWEARAVVVAGLRMGEFPVTAREDLFLTDADRAAVEKQTGLALPNRLDDALRREFLLFYAAVTRSREHLVLTAPAADSGGNPALRSPFLDVALSILPETHRVLEGRERSPGDVRPAPGETLHRADLERTALAALTERFTPGHPTEIRPHTGYALLPHLVGGEGSVVRSAARWFAPPTPSLREGGPARRGMDRPRLRSASSLADFAQCPYRHFARKGLRLDELPGDIDEGIDALLAGSIAHKALEFVVKEHVTTADGTRACVDRAFAALAGHLRRDLRVEAVRAQLRRVLPRLVASWEARGGLVPGFRPRDVPEWAFGTNGPEVSVGTGPDAVRLTGAVDRIDVDGAGNAVVVDYKWSAMSRFAGVERKIEDGLDLQLPIYVIAAQRALGLRVIAAGYVTLREPSHRRERWIPVVAGGAALAGAKSGGAEPPRGFGVGDGSEGVAAAEAAIVRLDARIRAGECATDPHDPERCGAGACPFADLCRFDGGAS